MCSCQRPRCFGKLWGGASDGDGRAFWARGRVLAGDRPGTPPILLLTASLLPFSSPACPPSHPPSFAPFLFGMQGFQEGNQQPLQPEKVGWVRKFCGKGIFREIWKNRFVVLKGDQLYISEKEVGKRLLTSYFFSRAFPLLSFPPLHFGGG